MVRWLVMLLLLTNCASYIPLQEPAHSFNRLTEAEAHEVTIRLEHLGYQFNYLVFDLEVINHSSRSIRLSPHQNIFYYAAPKPFPIHDGPFDFLQASARHSRLLNKQIYAETPSDVLDKVNQKIKSREAARVFFLLVGVGLAVYDGVQDVKDSKKEEWTYRDASKAAGRNALVQTALVSSDMAGVSAAQAVEESFYLPHDIFPSSTLLQDETKRGKLFLPFEANYRYLRIIISIEQTDYVFDFKTAGTQ